MFYVLTIWSNSRKIVTGFHSIIWIIIFKIPWPLLSEIQSIEKPAKISILTPRGNRQFFNWPEKCQRLFKRDNALTALTHAQRMCRKLSVEHVTHHLTHISWPRSWRASREASQLRLEWWWVADDLVISEGQMNSSAFTKAIAARLCSDLLN